MRHNPFVILTGLDGSPVCVNLAAIEGVERDNQHTRICTKGGHVLKVSESVEQVVQAITPIVIRLDVLNKPLEHLHLTVRASNCLHGLGAKTIGELVQHTPDELLGIRGLGKLVLQEVTDKLATLGLRLAQDE